MTRGRAKMCLAAVWAYPLWRAVGATGARDDVAADVAWWIDCIDADDLRALDDYPRFAYLTAALSEFRNLVHYRLRGAPAPVRLALRLVYRPNPTLVLSADSIGPALFIQHGLATIVTAESIGDHCWINQQVTIGHTAGGRPTLRNRVRVGAGAMVLGPITLHDGATVGANATVLHDVGPGETMVAPHAVRLERGEPATDPAPDAGPDGAPTTAPE